jgi:hypothetical protein
MNTIRDRNALPGVLLLLALPAGVQAQQLALLEPPRP